MTSGSSFPSLYHWIVRVRSLGALTWQDSVTLAPVFTRILFGGLVIFGGAKNRKSMEVIIAKRCCLMMAFADGV